MDLDQQLISDLRLILAQYPEVKILSSRARSMEAQMAFVVDRWSGYPTTKREFMNHFQLKEHELPNSIDRLSRLQDEFLRSRIQYHSDNGTGYKHLKGNAVDISVLRIKDWKVKQTLKERIESFGYSIILERPPKYYVPIHEATTFHVELKK